MTTLYFVDEPTHGTAKVDSIRWAGAVRLMRQHGWRQVSRSTYQRARKKFYALRTTDKPAQG